MDPTSSDDWTRAEHSMGTSIMAVAYDGGVVLGADSRTTTGAYIANRVSDKITPLTGQVACCRSGSAADTQALADYVRYFLDAHGLELGEEPTVKTAATMFRLLMYNNKQLMAGVIVAGWDKQKGGQVFSLPLGGTLMQQPFVIGGSGSTYIYGFCDANYKEGMTKEECKKFVVTALSLAMGRDGSSGGVIRTCVIDEKGSERDFFPGNKLPEFYQG
eukprot:Plantae.Rhodophyta-Hildenbrandia_rubra.ctg6638.p1 GENE.Plantae.Rhodophyta-Hildenbrandia_rubra.ctg6638~~Plantae.Rhodophyta-Hildenbrandia_rubra.ctg6638.p1  ORF type:complete len:217 (-),score=38.61 Plantae.Rhodophyta-Hildenbrandia_rubra.ctg6638:385-1035(-)